jgi:LysM repeat protein
VATIAAVAAPAGLAGRDPQIAGLQVALRAKGLYGGAIDAIRGPLTIRGVRKLQRAHHLRVTGHATRRTRAALGALGRPLYGTRLLARGEIGWDVAVLQYLLVRHGIAVPVNGYFGARTLRGVRRFQRRAHLVADGIAGPRTRAAIKRSRIGVVSDHATRLTLVHVVRPGESLTGLALRYGTSVAALAHLNHLDPHRYLLIGTRLRVPVPRRAVVRQTPERTISIAAAQWLLDRWAVHYAVSVHLVRGLAWMESGYNNRLVSATGARGIMQIEPYTWRFVETVLIGHRVRHGPNGNIHIGVRYLRHLLDDFHGDTRHALAGWYQGERAVRAHGMYTETRVFVRDVLSLAARM